MVGDNAATALFRYVERIERLAEEAQGIKDDTKEVYDELKSQGFDAAIVRKVIAARKNYSGYRETRSAMDEMLDALDQLEVQQTERSVAEGV